MFRTLAFSAIALASISTAHAEYFDIDQPVTGHTGKTWFDVTKAIVPDLRWERGRAVGSTSIPLRYVDPTDDEIARPEASFIVHSVDVEPIQSEGRALTLVSVGLGPADGWAIQIEALAVFDENLVLLDAINLGQDQLTALRGPPIHISATDQAVLTYSEHFNSNQTYGSYALVMVRGGEFQTIDNVGLLSDRWCGHERSQTLEVTSADGGQGYWPITVTVTDKLVVPAEDIDDGACGEDWTPETPFERQTAVTYSWNASMGHYVTDGDGFAAIAEENSDRY